MAAHNNLIDLSGDFEFTMDDYVEWLLQERDADSPLQTATDLECEGENHISCDGNIVRDGDLFCDGDILCSGDSVGSNMIECTGQILCAGSILCPGDIVCNGEIIACIGLYKRRNQGGVPRRANPAA